MSNYIGIDRYYSIATLATKRNCTSISAIVIDDTVHGNLSEWRLFLIFSSKVAVVLDFLTLQDKHNIRTLSTLSVNITFI